MTLRIDIVRLSPNFNKSPVVGKTVIIHATRSGKSMNPSEFEGTLNYMATAGKTSSQLVISRGGITARVVPDDRQAWHASEDNDNTWGIELEQGDEADGFTDIQMEALARAGRHYMDTFGVPPVHVFSSSQPGFVGHSETEQGKRFGKSDPGRLFDWDKFIRLLTANPAEEIANMVWARWKDRPDSKIFRTYLLWTDASGLKSRFVPNFEEHQALEESQVAGPLLALSIETLRQFKCSPDPAA